MSRRQYEHNVGALSPAWSNPYGLSQRNNAQLRRAASSGKYVLPRGETLDEGTVSPAWRNPYNQPQSVRRSLRVLAPPAGGLPRGTVLGGPTCLGDCGGCTKRGYCAQGCASGCGNCSSKRTCLSGYGSLGAGEGMTVGASSTGGRTREEVLREREAAGITTTTRLGAGTTAPGVYRGPLRGTDKVEYDAALTAAQRLQQTSSFGGGMPGGMPGGMGGTSALSVTNLKAGVFPFQTFTVAGLGTGEKMGKFYNERKQELTIRSMKNIVGYAADALDLLKDLACKALTAGNNSPQIKDFAAKAAMAKGVPPMATEQAFQLASQLCGGQQPPPQDQQVDKAGSVIGTVAVVGGIGLLAYLLL